MLLKYGDSLPPFQILVRRELSLVVRRIPVRVWCQPPSSAIPNDECC